MILVSFKALSQAKLGSNWLQPVSDVWTSRLFTSIHLSFPISSMGCFENESGNIHVPSLWKGFSATCHPFLMLIRKSRFHHVTPKYRGRIEPRVIIPGPFLGTKLVLIDSSKRRARKGGQGQALRTVFP